MLNTIFRSKDRKRLLINFGSLSILQGLVYIFPLITIPYLLQTLGANRYGLVAFAQALIFYFNLFTDYGFGLSGPQELAVNKRNKKKINSIFSSIMSSKVILMLLAFIVYGILIALVPKLRNEATFFIIIFGVVIGQVFFPAWLFQGMERMHYTTITQLIGKLVYTIPIFIFIHKPKDYIYMPIIIAVNFLVMGLVGLLIAFFKLKVKYQWPGFKAITRRIKKDFDLFITNFSTYLYKNITPVLLGFLVANEFVAFFYAAERIIKALQMLTSPFTQVLYPYLSHKAAKLKPKNIINVLLKVASYYSLLIIAACVVLFLIIDQAVLVVMPNIYSEVVLRNIKIMLPVVYLNSINFLLGVVGLVNLKERNKLTIFVLITGGFHIILTLILSYKWYDLGASIAVVISEAILFILLVGYFLKLKKQYSG